MTLCVPGDCIIAADDKHVAGDGVYIRSGFIHAALAGTITLTELKESKQTVVSVVGPRGNCKKIPCIGDIVTCKVIFVGSNFARVTLCCIADVPLKSTLRGIIRKEDILEVEKKDTEVYKCFRLGDIVLARVLGMGEGRSYLLSTAEDELGVAVAYSAMNKQVPMLPVNWTQMRCPSTYVKELRKVAGIGSITVASPTENEPNKLS